MLYSTNLNLEYFALRYSMQSKDNWNKLKSLFYKYDYGKMTSLTNDTSH